MKKSTVILYHANCADGFTAAWAAWKKLKNKAEYVAVKHQVPPPKNLKGKTLFLLDFSYDAEITEQLIEENKSVVIIDHHVTTEEQLKKIKLLTYKYDRIYRLVGERDNAENSYAILDKSHSGAYLAWRYFHKIKPVPRLVRYVEDNDLWKFKMPHSKIISLYLDAHDFEFKTWDKIVRLLENPKTRRASIEQGAFVSRYAAQIIRNVSNSATKVRFAGRTVLVANSPVLRSEIGHELVKKRPPFSVVWREKGGQIVVSLRSDGTFDVAKLAEKYGGGGHKSAAGFMVRKNKKVPWKI